MRLRPSVDAAWVEVPLFRDVRSHFAADEFAYLAWGGGFDADGEDLPLQPDEPTVSAYDYSGACVWTLCGRDLPYYDLEGARKRGISYVSTEASDATSPARLLLRSGPWFCEIVDPRTPALGPVEHTQRPKKTAVAPE